MILAIDVTGSMQPCIDGVRDNLKALVDGFNAANTSLDWKAKAVGFRDTEESARAFEGFENAFTSDVGELSRQLDQFEADSGGDEPESDLDCLLKIARETEWPHPFGASHRVVVLFTDATSKPTVDARLWKEPDLTANLVASALLSQKVKLFLFGPECPVLHSLAALMGSKCNYAVLGSNGEDVHSELTSRGMDHILKDLGKTVSAASATAV